MSSISAVGGMSMMPSSSISSSLSAKQLESLDSILQNYNADNMTSEDYESLKSDLDQANIRPSRAVNQALSDAGFETDKVMASSGKMPPPPPPSSGTEDSSLLSDEELAELIQMLTEEYDPESMTTEDYASMRQDLVAAGVTPSAQIGDALMTAGYSLPEVPQDSSIGGRHTINSVSSTSKTSTMQNYLEQFKSGDIEKSTLDKLLGNLSSLGYQTKGLVVDLYSSVSV